MVNLNLWLRLTEVEYAALMRVYQDEQAMKFAISMAINKIIKEETKHLNIEHITPDINGESA